MNKQLLFLLTQLLLVHASPKEGQKLSDYLWEQTTQYQQQALNANLIYGMKEICLDPSEFAHYLVDDAAYLYNNSVNWKTAAGRSNDNATLQDYLNTKAVKWNGYWDSMRASLHIANAEGIAKGEAVSNYLSHIKNVAENEIPVYTILALTPCAKLWPWLGEQIGSGTKDFGVYTSWVEENLDPTYKGYEQYDAIVDWNYENGDVKADKALEIFTASMQGEVNFFNSVERCEPTETETSVDKTEL